MEARLTHQTIKLFFMEDITQSHAAWPELVPKRFSAGECGSRKNIIELVLNRNVQNSNVVGSSCRYISFKK